MREREERFYEVAGRELESETVSQGAWGKAVSLALGDEPKARALYINLRVAQQEREYQQSIADLLREQQAEIIAGRQFVCPYCQARTTAKVYDVSFLDPRFR